MLIRKVGQKEWQEPHTTSYASEEALEDLLAEAPHLLPGGTGTRMAVVRQMIIPHGKPDLVGVDTVGAITVVECKLKTNSDIKRKIVGQAFDYASILWGMTYDDFDEAFKKAKAHQPIVGETLVDKVAALANESNESFDREAFCKAVSENLSAGSFRLILAVDTITDELKRIVTYLNSHTDARVQVLALELSYMEHNDFQILLPTTYGAEGTAPKVALDQTRLLEEKYNRLAILSSRESIKEARRLMEILEDCGYSILPGSKSVMAKWPSGKSLSRHLTLDESSHNVATASINFEEMAKQGFTLGQMEQLALRLSRIVGMKPNLASLKKHNYRKNPFLLIKDLFEQSGVVELIAEALAELVQPPPEPALCPNIAAAPVEPSA